MRVELSEGRAGVETDLMVLNMGPQHPSTHGVLRLVLTLDGERIVDVEPIVGYLHRGKEKHSEHLTYMQFIPYTDRLDYTAPLQNNVAFCLAVEKVIGLEIPPRAETIRVILAELSRIAAHLVWLASSGLEMGAVTIFFHAFREREAIYDLLEPLTGVRMNNTFVRIGGLAADLPEEVRQRIDTFARALPERIDEYERLLTRNRIWYERNRGIGRITAAQAIDLGVTGPVLRSTGVPHDVRRAQPYLDYDRYDFEVPVGTQGDAYDRYLVRIEEMRQSARILRQALETLPAGPWCADDARYVPPPKRRVFTSMEELIYQFKIVTEMTVPPGEAYVAIEAAKGELGFYCVSEGGSSPHRLKIRSPSFVNLQALPLMARGARVSDMVAIIASLDPVMGEVDR